MIEDTQDTESEQELGITQRERLLAALEKEPEGARIFAIVISPDGALSGYSEGAFRTWEMQGILEFFRVRAEIDAANSLFQPREDEPDGDESDRVVG